MASIRKLNNGTFQATISLGRDYNGKQLRSYVTCETERQCKKEAAKIEASLKLHSAEKPFDEWVDMWLNVNENRLSPSTLIGYTMYADTHLKPFFKHKKLRNITELDVTQYVNQKLNTLSKCTVHKHFHFLKEVLFDALKSESPMIGMQAPSPDKYKPHVVTTEEFKSVLGLFAGTRYEPIILLAGLCGLRRGEIFGLRWRDIDSTSEKILIRNAVAKSKEGYVDKPPKSANGVRDISVPPVVLQKLLDMRKAGAYPEDKIFAFDPDTFTDRYCDVVKEAGLSIRFHDLRHYHAVWMYTNDVPDLYAAARMGHDIKVLKGIYQHLGLTESKAIDDKVITGLSDII